MTLTEMPPPQRSAPSYILRQIERGQPILVPVQGDDGTEDDPHIFDAFLPWSTVYASIVVEQRAGGEWGVKAGMTLRLLGSRERHHLRVRWACPRMQPPEIGAR